MKAAISLTVPDEAQVTIRLHMSIGVAKRFRSGLQNARPYHIDMDRMIKVLGEAIDIAVSAYESTETIDAG